MMIILQDLLNQRAAKFVISDPLDFTAQIKGRELIDDSIDTISILNNFLGHISFTFD